MHLSISFVLIFLPSIMFHYTLYTHTLLTWTFVDVLPLSFTEKQKIMRRTEQTTHRQHQGSTIGHGSTRWPFLELSKSNKNKKSGLFQNLNVPGLISPTQPATPHRRPAGATWFRVSLPNWLQRCWETSFRWGSRLDFPPQRSWSCWIGAVWEGVVQASWAGV